MNQNTDSFLKPQVRALVAAFTFLTRLPVGGFVAHDLADLSRSALYFPLVGLMVGAIGALVFAGAQLFWSPLVSVVLSVIATVLATGAFHEDALADSLDGFGGGWTKEQVLAIMKDSRVGSYALIGVVLMTFAKVAALLSIQDRAEYGGIGNRANFAGAWSVARALIAAHVVARWSSVCLIRTHAYVRSDDATAKPAAGRPFVNATTNAQLFVASVISLAIILPLLGVQAVWICLGVLFVTLLAGRYFTKRIGGITGDALGAANQLVELTVYLALAARPFHDVFA